MENHTQDLKYCAYCKGDLEKPDLNQMFVPTLISILSDYNKEEKDILICSQCGFIFNTYDSDNVEETFKIHNKAQDTYNKMIHKFLESNKDNYKDNIMDINLNALTVITKYLIRHQTIQNNLIPNYFTTDKINVVGIDHIGAYMAIIASKIFINPLIAFYNSRNKRLSTHTILYSNRPTLVFAGSDVTIDNSIDLFVKNLVGSNKLLPISIYNFYNSKKVNNTWPIVSAYVDKPSLYEF